jgi:hypothetical protein
MMKVSLHRLAALGALVAGWVGVFPAYAGPAEVALLANYIGEWSGSSVLEGGDFPEAFSCRLSVGKGNRAKINYAGRCTLVNMNLSVSGTIAYDDATRTYQAIMGSNAGYKGVAVGRVKGDTITFALSEQEQDRAGNLVRLGATITLIKSTTIEVDYEVEFNNSGQVLTAAVPFSR